RAAASGPAITSGPTPGSTRNAAPTSRPKMPPVHAPTSAPRPGHGPLGDEPDRLLDRLEVLADDRQVPQRDARLLQPPHRLLGRGVVRVRGDDGRPALLRGHRHN